MGSAAPSNGKGQKKVRCELLLEGVEGYSLSGSIPLLLPKGSYKFPHSPTVESSDGHWIHSWIKESGLQPHGETEKDRDRFASEMALFCAYLVPSLDPGSDAMKFFLFIMTLGFMGDDELEGRDLFGRDPPIGQQMARIAGDIFTGKYATFESIPISEEAFGFKTMLRAGWVAAQKANEHLPHFFRDSGHLAEAISLAYSATLSMEMEDHHVETLGELPVDSYHYFRLYEGGFLGFIELALLCTGAVPTADMRRNLLFKRILELAWHISINVNDLFGVRRELESGRGYNLVVYRSREVELPEAFAEVVQIVQKEVENMSALCLRFRTHYPDDAHGHHVLGVLESLVDGHIYSFATNRRYGNVSIHFVEE